MPWNSANAISRESSGAATTFSIQLEVANKGPVGLEHNNGVQNRICGHTHATTSPAPNLVGQEEEKLVQEELENLTEKGAVVESRLTSDGGFVSTIFLVPKKDGGQRPVINLKALNQFVQTDHFKMEGIHTMKQLVKPTH